MEVKTQLNLNVHIAQSTEYYFYVRLVFFIVYYINVSKKYKYVQFSNFVCTSFCLSIENYGVFTR